MERPYNVCMSPLKIHRLPTEWNIVPAYLLLAGAAFFLWPVVIGIPGVGLRLGWIGAAIALLGISAWSLANACKAAGQWRVRWKNDVSWIPVLGFLAVLAAYLIHIPPLSYSDEALISVPGLALATKTANVTGWPLLQAAGIAGLIAMMFGFARWSIRGAIVTVLILAGFASAIAMLLPEQHDQMIRFPPIVHFIQFPIALLTRSSISVIRLGNLFWTALLALGIWQLTPRWGEWQRIAAFAALVLGPMGWIYHIQLYQACAEITLGFLAVLLVMRITEEEQPTVHASLLGVLLTTWILIRPTALAAAVLCVLLLLGLRRTRRALHVAGIALPIGLLWYLLSPIYTKQYGSVVGNALLNADVAEGTFVGPFVTSTLSFPSMFHPAVIALLIVGSLLIVLRGGPRERRLLLIAWVLGYGTSMAQLQITPLYATGYPRYSVLLLLPLAAVLASLFAKHLRSRECMRLLGGLGLIVLVIVTPWRTIRFLQEMRRSPATLYRSAGAGEAPLPATSVILDVLRTTKHPILLAPDLTILEAAIASGLISIEDRTAIYRASAAWDPSLPKRPVIIQAPIETSYQYQRTPVEEDRLRLARAWALRQPHHDIVRLGIEEAVIVRK